MEFVEWSQVCPLINRNECYNILKTVWREQYYMYKYIYIKDRKIIYAQVKKKRKKKREMNPQQIGD